MQQEMQKPISLTLMCAVCDRERGEKVVAVLEKHKSFFNLAMLGKGTASSKILGYLGLGETDKTVFFCIMPRHIAEECVEKLNETLHLDKPGHGIAFMTRIYEGCYHIPVHFTGEEDGGETVEKQSTHDLIMVMTNRGYTEEVMELARKAGATGGTVLHARGCGLSGAEKFFGVTIQPEKEVVMIVAPSDISCGIMAAIGEGAGPGTDASAVSFSMPLNHVMGLGGGIPAAAE